MLILRVAQYELSMAILLQTPDLYYSKKLKNQNDQEEFALCVYLCTDNICLLR